MVPTGARAAAERPVATGRPRATEGGAPPILADAELLKIVFLNLLINSTQAMKGQGEISIRMSMDGRECVVVVADTGPGISPDVQGRLFTPFVTTKARGTGLGLSMVYELARKMDAGVTVESTVNEGSTFTLILPVRSAAEAKASVAKNFAADASAPAPQKL